MLRNFYKSDIRKVLAVEEAVHITPWTEDTFLTCFQAGYMGWLIEEEMKIIGFIIISLHQQECHILNVCVARDFQRQGHGQKMLAHVLQVARQHGAGIAYLEVRKSNKNAISLYRKMQFHLIGERKNYYPATSGPENALIFAISLHDEFSGFPLPHPMTQK